MAKNYTVARVGARCTRLAFDDYNDDYNEGGGDGLQADGNCVLTASSDLQPSRRRFSANVTSRR